MHGSHSHASMAPGRPSVVPNLISIRQLQVWIGRSSKQTKETAGIESNRTRQLRDRSPPSWQRVSASSPGPCSIDRLGLGPPASPTVRRLGASCVPNGQPRKINKQLLPPFFSPTRAAGGTDQRIRICLPLIRLIWSILSFG